MNIYVKVLINLITSKCGGEEWIKCDYVHIVEHITHLGIDLKVRGVKKVNIKIVGVLVSNSRSITNIELKLINVFIIT